MPMLQPVEPLIEPFGIPTPWHATMMELYDLDERSIYLHMAPLYHAAPLGFNLRTLRAGGTTVIMRRFVGFYDMGR